MAPAKTVDASRASAPPSDGEQFEFNEFEEELKRLSAANQELLEEFHHPTDEKAPAEPSEDLERLRQENAELKGRIRELEALVDGRGEELWVERQRAYEALMEEKSEVIRGLHQKIQEMQESVDLGEAPAPAPMASATRLGQAEEILRLKRELEEQRRQLEQDEEDMMTQMRQMEMAMAKERAEMARQRQEAQRLKAELNREIEQTARDPQLKERLNTLRRKVDSKQADADVKPTTDKPDQKSSGFFRRIFGN